MTNASMLTITPSGKKSSNELKKIIQMEKWDEQTIAMTESH